MHPDRASNCKCQTACACKRPMAHTMPYRDRSIKPLKKQNNTKPPQGLNQSEANANGGISGYRGYLSKQKTVPEPCQAMLCQRTQYQASPGKKKKKNRAVMMCRAVMLNANDARTTSVCTGDNEICADKCLCPSKLGPDAPCANHQSCSWWERKRKTAVGSFWGCCVRPS